MKMNEIALVYFSSSTKRRRDESGRVSLLALLEFSSLSLFLSLSFSLSLSLSLSLKKEKSRRTARLYTK